MGSYNLLVREKEEKFDQEGDPSTKKLEEGVREFRQEAENTWSLATEFQDMQKTIVFQSNWKPQFLGTVWTSPAGRMSRINLLFPLFLCIAFAFALLNRLYLDPSDFLSYFLPTVPSPAEKGSDKSGM